jgi:hypothetical protein
VIDAGVADEVVDPDDRAMGDAGRDAGLATELAAVAAVALGSSAPLDRDRPSENLVVRE